MRDGAVQSLLSPCLSFCFLLQLEHPGNPELFQVLQVSSCRLPEQDQVFKGCCSRADPTLVLVVTLFPVSI